MGTLIGNLMIKNHNNDFPSDVFITFETLNAKITIMDDAGKTQQIGPLEFIKTDIDPEKNLVIEHWRILR